jgi:hypothetical protein
MNGAGTIPRCLTPFTLDATNNKILINQGAAAGLTVTIPVGEYGWLNDPASASDLCLALKTQLEAAVVGAQHWSVVILSTGKVRFTCDETFKLRWTSATTTLSPILCGFAGADADGVLVGGVYVLDSEFQVGSIWNPEDVYSRDSEDRGRYRVVTTETPEWRARTQRWSTKGLIRDLEIECLPRRKIYIADEVSYGEAFERLHDYLSEGGWFWFQRDVTSLPASWTAVRYRIRKREWQEEIPARIPEDCVQLFTVAFPLARYVP